jgi:hypothetical protein
MSNDYYSHQSGSARTAAAMQTVFSPGFCSAKAAMLLRIFSRRTCEK